MKVCLKRVSAHRQARGHDGGPLCPCQTVQASPSGAAYLAHPARPARARHPAQDCGSGDLEGSNASAKVKPAPLTEFGVKVSIVTTNRRAPVASSCCTPGRCPATPTTATPRRGDRGRGEAHRSRDRARLCRQGIPRPRCGKSAPRLYIGSDAASSASPSVSSSVAPLSNP